MFSFFKKKPPASAEPAPQSTPLSPAPDDVVAAAAKAEVPAFALTPETAPGAAPVAPAKAVAAASVPVPGAAPVPWHKRLGGWSASKPSGQNAPPAAAQPIDADRIEAHPIDEVPAEELIAARLAAVHRDATEPVAEVVAETELPAEPAPLAESAAQRRDWLARLRGGLRKTGSSITQVFTGGARIGDELYEELEAALLQADAGGKATEYLLGELKARVKRAGANDPAVVRGLLADALADLLVPLERPLQVGLHTPTVIMVVGVNGAGKTTTIGKLTRHLVDAGQKVLLAAADT
ncbi:MAG: signal recognition particle receptor subunit alpha, partial [Caldimonas sp.]